MTPPPINIDGTNENYSNVTIDGQDVEQITIDGQDVLSTIPDSAVSQFKFDEGSGTSLTNEFSGQPDATINGPDWVADSDLVGDYGLDFVSANSDDVAIDSTYSFADNGEQFAFAVTVNMDDLSIDQIIWRQFPGGSNAGFAVGTGNSNSGKFAARYYDGSTTQATVSTTSATTNRLRLGVDFDAVNDSATIYINGSDVTDGSELVDLNSGGEDNYLGQQDSSYFLDAIMDNPIWYNDLLGSSGHSDDYNAQPWS